MPAPVGIPETAQDAERSASQSRALRALEAFPFDLRSLYVGFVRGGGVDVSIHDAPPDEVAVLAVLLGVEADPDPDPYSSGPIHFGRDAHFTGGVALDWYPAPPEPRPEPEHRRRQWGALTTALAAYAAG
jgi:hypothetical protein